MLPTSFVQTQYNDSKNQTKKVKTYLVWSYVFKTLSLIFVVLGFYNAWYFSGFVLLFLIGVALRQLTLEMVGSFEYFLVGERLIFSATTNFNVKKKIYEIKIDDIIDFSKIEFIPENEAIVFASQDDTLYMLKTETFLIYFAPSRYMVALINNLRQN